LAPTVGKGLVVEEGLAVIFGDEISSQHNLGCEHNMASYQKAKAAAQELLAIDAGIVKRIRETEPCFDKWTPALLVDHGVPQQLAERLCEPFKREG